MMHGFDHDKHISKLDLFDYLKRDDYLGGYTDKEKRIIRKNLGILGWDDNVLCLEVTCDEIRRMIHERLLIVGMCYCVLDFRSKYKIGREVYQSANSYKLIIRAIGKADFDSRVVILSGECLDSYKWEARFELALDRDSIGKITYLKDDFGNEAYYDFKSVRFRRTREELEKIGVRIGAPYKDFLTFTSDSYNNKLGPNSFNTVFLNQAHDNVCGVDFSNNTFADKCYDNYFDNHTENNIFDSEVQNVKGQIQNREFIFKKDKMNAYVNKTDLCTKPFLKTFTKVKDDFCISYLDSETLTVQNFKI